MENESPPKKKAEGTSPGIKELEIMRMRSFPKTNAAKVRIIPQKTKCFNEKSRILTNWNYESHKRKENFRRI